MGGMNPKLVRRNAVIVYVLFGILILSGVLASPPIWSTIRPSSPVANVVGKSEVFEGFTEAGKQTTFLVSVALATPVIEPRAMTSLASAVTALYGLGSTNLSRVIRLTSSTLVINDAFESNRTQSENPSGIPLKISIDKLGDWEGTSNFALTFTQVGNVTGSLTSTGVLKNGTTITLRSTLAFAGLTVSGPAPFWAVLPDWAATIVLCTVGVVTLVVGIERVLQPSKKPFHKR